MAVTNHERVGKALELLRQGLTPFVERELKSHHRETWIEQARSSLSEVAAKNFVVDGAPNWDAAALLLVMWNQWNTVFRDTLGQSERTLVSELRDVRNDWAHQAAFSGDDAYRHLDSAARLLTAISAPEAAEIETMKEELLRVRYDEQVRSKRRKAAGTAIESATATGNLRPWREVVTPHPDVASGRYEQAEFAADLWQVHLGEGSDEYRDPVEFFRRTFLTESLREMLVGGVRRISGGGGDPVVQLQTNFGGGKTHSMLALYHLFSGANASELAGIEAVLSEAGVKALPEARRVVLVGNRLSPGNPVTKPDGTVVRTLWGELAYQLGGKTAFSRLQQDDERATSPGDVLRELLKEYGPCLVLIDEWVAYARQLHDQSDLPAGSFETQFTFAQVLTESAKLAGNCLLVISLPASDGSSPHSQTDDVEVGGIRGREALDRLRNVVGRLDSSWRPATAEEGFEIVRRRLFEPLSGPEAFTQRDVTARAFSELYRKERDQFPPECHGIDYEKRIQAAYPIHPEIFDRLYTDWSTLVKFQRTRGVLRLMAAVIHCLWERGDRNPLILPSMIPIDDRRVQFELTRYLSDHWVPIIEKDVDGPNSLPLKIDAEVQNFGKVHGARRVARTIYLGSAPTTVASHRGIEDRRIKLGCVMPGESPAVFGDALRRLATLATYLYQDGPRFWYATQPTVTKLAEDRAEQLRNDPDKAIQELEERLRRDLVNRGDFSRIHPMPRSGADVPDDFEGRLVVLPAEHPYSREPGNPAEIAAKAILESRGNTPRQYRNTLVFLVADKLRWQDLDDALRRLLAWKSILAERDVLNLDPHQVRQAERQKENADNTVTGRLPETYQWLLVPEQSKPHLPMTLQAMRLTGADALAVRASKRLRNEELFLTSMGSTILRKHMDDVPLWRGDHVSVRQLVDDFASYPYLPRLAGPEVLLQSIRDGVSLMTWSTETFAHAEGYDEARERYRGLRSGQLVNVTIDGSALLVKPATATAQIEADAATAPPANGVVAQPGVGGGEYGSADPDSTTAPGATAKEAKPVLRRFHGTVRLDAMRVGRDASQIAEEVLSHLTGLVGAEVNVTLEVEAFLPDGAPDQVVRTVTENSRTLQFTSHGFKSE